MEDLKELSTEVRRITACIYTPSLKKLHDFLEKADSRLLQRWARGNACQIDSLVSVVLEGLELWPFTLDILRILGCIPSFRDAALQQKPMLLDTLLNKATESASGFEKYAATCVAMVSAPLGTAIPSCFPKFLLECLQRAVRSLSVETIRPVYQILSGLGPSYLDILPLDVLIQLQDHLIQVTKTTDSEGSTILLCLAVLVKFGSRPCAATKPNGEDESPLNSFPMSGEDSPTGSADKFLAARQFLDAKRQPKMLDVAVLKAIRACSEGREMSMTEAIESLELCREIVEAVDCNEKRAWLARNGAKTTKMMKLYNKILRPAIEADVQCAALNFLVSLANGQPLPEELGCTLEIFLLTSNTSILSSSAVEHCVVQMKKTNLDRTLLALMRLACEDQLPSSERLVRVDNAFRLVSIMIAIIPKSLDFQGAVRHAVSRYEVSALLQQFALKTPQMYSAQGHAESDVCPLTYVEALVRFHQRTIGILLTSALHTTSHEGGLDTLTLTNLLEKMQKLSNDPATCRHHGNSKLTPELSKVSFFEAESTPRIQSASHDWRTDLVRELRRDASYRHESVVRMVGEICRDLEIRCDESERPLRDEKSKSRLLQQELEAAQAMVSELEFQAQDRTVTWNVLKNERDTLSGQVKETERRLEDLGTSLENIQHEFDQANIDAARAAQAATENARQRDLAYLATMTGRDEMLEEQALKLAASTNHVKELEEELDQKKRQDTKNSEILREKDAILDELNRQEARNEETIREKKAMIQELNTAIATAKELEALRQSKIDSLITSETNLIATNQCITAKAQEASDRSASSISDLEAQLQVAMMEATKCRQEHDTQMDAKDTKILQLEESYRSLNERWQKKLDEAHKTAAIASEKSALSIGKLQKKVRKLREEHEERAKDFAEAQGLRSRLMAVMGSSKTPKASPAPTTRTSHCEQNDEHHANRESPKHALGSSISSRSDPTPKRIKTHRSSKSLFAYSTKPVNPAASSGTHGRSEMKSIRLPLADLGSIQNHNPLTPTQPQRRKGSKTPAEQAIQVLDENSAAQRLESDDESFGGGDIFTSTDQQQLSALRTRLPRNTYDDTTTDF